MKSFLYIGLAFVHAATLVSAYTGHRGRIYHFSGLPFHVAGASLNDPASVGKVPLGPVRQRVAACTWICAVQYMRPPATLKTEYIICIDFRAA